MNIDGHIHFSHISRIDELASYLDALGLDAVGIVSLPDPARINYNPEAFAAKAQLPGRCFVFGGLDYGRELAPQVAELHALGADGLKLWDGKPSYQAHTGIAVDSEQLLAVYREAGRLGMPIVQHVADPPVFWQGAAGGMNREVGIDYEAPEIPGFEELIRQAEHAVAAVPECRFILAHLVFLAGDLERLDAMLESYPNLSVDLAPGLYFFPELAARPDDARAFFEKHAGRIIFGTDGFWFPETQRGLPQGGLERNLVGARRLVTFLETTEEMENPFEPSRAGRPLVRGLGLADGKAAGGPPAGAGKPRRGAANPGGAGEPRRGAGGKPGGAAKPGGAGGPRPVTDTLAAVYAGAFTRLLGSLPCPLDHDRVGAYIDGFAGQLRERRGRPAEGRLARDLADVGRCAGAVSQVRGGRP
jgi:predicted TIM-barrel fold metal-dependent hydrolase